MCRWLGSSCSAWPANEGGVRAIDVTIVDDAIADADEQFSLAFSSSDPIAVFATSDPRATITITDDETATADPTVTLRNTRVVASEGASEVTFEAHRLGDLSQAVFATWTTMNDTGSSSSIASSGVDYIAASGTLGWAAGDSSPKTFTVPIVDDGASETAEFVGLHLSANYPAVTINGSTGAIIMDNDPAPTQPVVSIGPATSFAEDVGSANIMVTLTGVPGNPVIVTYEVTLETAEVTDLLWTSGGTLTWAVGDSTPKQISIPITNDGLDEIDETFLVGISAVSGGAQIGAASSRFTIIDDDSTPAGQNPPAIPAVQVPAVSVREGDRVARLTVSRTGSTDALTVSCDVASGTAGEPEDFIGGSYRLFWAAGDTESKQCEIQLNGDAQVEPDETFTVQLMPHVPGAELTPMATATITIVDDDGPNSSPARIDFVDTSLSVNESATSVTLQVGRSGNTSIASSIDYVTVAGSAGNADYATTTGTLTWDVNDTSIKLITVALTPDAADEADESFTVQLRNVSSGSEIGAESAGVSIVDDDTAPGAPDSGSSGGGGGGGQESLISLLALAVLVSVRLVSQRRRRGTFFPDRSCTF